MKKTILLALLVLSYALSFGQATGYNLSNFPSSGSIGTAASTVDSYSRININQTTAGVALTVPPPTNTTTKVTEVWIANKGTVSLTIRPLPDLTGFVLDTGQTVILKWIGLRYSVVGKGNMVDLSGYIKLDGTSPATTGNINFGNYNGVNWNANPNVYIQGNDGSGSRFIKSYVSEGNYFSNFYLADNNIYIESNRKSGFSIIQGSSFSASDNQITFNSDSGGTKFSSLSASTSGVGIRSNNIGSSAGFVYLKTNSVGSGNNYTQQLQAANGTIALTSDIPSVSGFITSVSGTTNRITSTGGTTPVLDISASYVGQSSITTLGTVGTGVWQGTAIADSYISSATTWNAKQAALVSGTNIKTLYGTTLLGSGDAGIAPPTYGGTGVNNGTNTITLSGSLTTTGAFNPTFAIPRTTTWTLPNTANETLAGLGTAQTWTATNTFTPVQRFSSAGFTVNDGTSNILGWYSSATNVLRSDYGTVVAPILTAGTRVSVPSSQYDGNGINHTTNFQLIASGTSLYRSTLSTTLSTLGLGGGSATGSISVATGAYSAANASIGSGSLAFTTGALTNAATLSTQSSGNITFSTGTITGGSGVRGYIGLGTTSTQPISFWGATATAAPTNATGTATIGGVGGTNITDTTTFTYNGKTYTLQQVMAALLSTGILQ